MPPSRLPAYVTAGRRQQGLSAGVAVQGLDEAIAFINLLPERIVAQAQQIFLEEARPVVAEARSTGPRVSGDLLSTLKTKAITKPLRPGVKISVGGPKAPYAGVVMFAHKAGTRRNLTPNPFLIRAMQNHTQGTADRVASALARLLES